MPGLNTAYIGETPNKTDWMEFMRLNVVLIFLLLVLTGCFAGRSSHVTEEPEPCNQLFDAPEDTVAVEAVAEATGPIPFTVLYAIDNIPWAMYEPAEGAYLGAWLRPDMSKSEFEDMIEKKHGVFAHEMVVGDEFPTTWILQSIASQAAPLIVLRLSGSSDDDFPLAELAMFAYELGNFNFPAFIVFNPHIAGLDINAEDYVLLFRYARIIFRTYAPMAAFVWHGYDNLATTESPFYPGHDVVDWVSLEILAPQGSEGFKSDIPEELMPFYLSFQRYKPIILLPVGVSHFSRRDYVYRVPEAAAEIVRVYEALRSQFPRVRLVVYRDHGSTTPQGDDFSLTREESLISAYRYAITDSHFISRLGPGAMEGPIWMRSVHHGYYYEGQILIDREVLTARRHRPIPTVTTEINGRTFVDIEAVRGLEIEADHAKQIIRIIIE